MGTVASALLLLINAGCGCRFTRRLEPTIYNLRGGKVGYTRGTFNGVMGGKPMSGSYATFWKKGEDGKWRAAVDIASVGAAQ